MPLIIQENLVSRICLGTVQFGLDYGIANTRGKIPPSEVTDILTFAQTQGIKTLDTSMAYGESEKVIGEFIAEQGTSFEIISKILIDSISVHEEGIKSLVAASLKRLNIKQLGGCLIHRFDDFLKHEQLWPRLETLKQEGLINKIGFSLYKTDELDVILDRGIPVDLIQFPYSVFDRRFEHYLSRLKDRNVEIHVRSVFLQGLVFLKPDELPEKLQHASEAVRHLQEISNREHLSISSICLNYVLSNPSIDKVVIGGDHLNHFKIQVQDLQAFDSVARLRERLNGLAVSDENILLPYTWNS